MSFLKSSVSIPITPRASLYHPDGYGRDAYIFSNNGGLYKSGQRIINSRVSSPSILGLKTPSSK